MTNSYTLLFLCIWNKQRTHLLDGAVQGRQVCDHVRQRSACHTVRRPRLGDGSAV